MNLLSDILNYVRRIIKTPSNASITDALLIDYVNRFWLMDVDARIQLFDLKTKYQFLTIAGISDYNMPLYSPQTQPGNQVISPFPVYQGFFGPCYVNGIEMAFHTERDPFWNVWPNYIQSLPSVATGDGTTTTFSFTLPFFPAIPGHVDISGVVSTGFNEDPIFGNALNLLVPITSVTSGVFLSFTSENGSNVVVADSGQFLENANDGNLYGLLMQTGLPASIPSCIPLSGNSYSMTQNTVNYNTGLVNVTFPLAPPAGASIQAQCYFYQQGIPRAILYYDNIISVRPPVNTQYLVELGAYLTPAAFLTMSQAIPFAYMAEYVARGAARKILSDTGDWDQFNAYEPLFLEQERLVWKRSQRQFTSTRVQTIFSSPHGQQCNQSNIGAT